MLTLAAQWLVSLSVLVLAVLALRIARITPPEEASFRRAWAFTGGAFLILGLNAAFHDLFATAGFWAGPGSALWTGVIVAHPVLNHSRTFAEIAYSAVLCVLLLRPPSADRPPSIRRPLLVLCAAMLLGGAVGANETVFSGLTHFTAVALWDILTMMGMFMLLYVGISTGRMDRGLWFTLGIFAFALAISVIGFAALAQIDVVGEWHPRPSHLHLTKAVLHSAAAVVAWRHLARLRRHERPRGFFDSRHGAALSPSLHG